jgi:CheY-like chemotaxis protein
MGTADPVNAPGMADVITFLCVEDDPSVLAMEKMLLESAGFSVLTATSGEEAIEAFKQNNVQAVVMDYFLPGMNGLKAARMMKRLKPDVPIVFLSAYSQLSDESVGIAKWWIKKGDQEPEIFLARLRTLVTDSPSALAPSRTS